MGGPGTNTGTEFALNDPLAVQRWSTSLGVEAAKKQYFSKFIGTTNDSLLVLKDEMAKGAGDKVTVALRMKLTTPGIEGDALIEDTAAEEALVFFNDALFIDQLRKGTKSKGKMSEQRVPYNLRQEGRDALSTWWAEEVDEQIMFYLAGARGTGANFHQTTGFTGRANNTLQAPDAGHHLYGGVATVKTDMTTTDIISLNAIERLVAYAELTDPMVQPFNVEGESKFVLLMHTLQAFQLRTSVSDNDWLAIHKATDQGQGAGAMVYKNALGEYADVILHKHRNVVTFNDYGSGGTLNAARALFLGAQAGMIAYGQDNGDQRYSWHEETDDRGNSLAITAGSIFGVKKSRYNSKDFGVTVLDTYIPATV
jgi:N4-gp56 family major capsid protein